MLSRRSGFTLVEILVAMAIVAILLGLSMPSISTYLQSAKMNAAANSYLGGVQRARSEAIRRNVPVQFVLTNTPVAMGMENALAPSATGQNWVVRVFDPVLGAFELIEAKAATEGAASSNGQSTTILGSSAPTPFAGIVSFNGFGGTQAGDAYNLRIENPAGGTCAQLGGPMRCVEIRVPAGGLVRLCDPAVNALTDSRGC